MLITRRKLLAGIPSTLAGVIFLPHAARAFFRHGGANQAISIFLGQVATSTKIPMNISTTANRSLMTRKGHYARDTITSLQLVYPSWYVDLEPTGADVAPDLGAEN